MTSRLRKIIDWAVGLTLIGIGVVGGFIPILQGWVFVLAGLAVLSSHAAWAQSLYGRLKNAGKELKSRMAARRGNAD